MIISLHLQGKSLKISYFREGIFVLAILNMFSRNGLVDISLLVLHIFSIL